VIKTVFVPVSRKLKAEEEFFLQARKQFAQWQQEVIAARLTAQAELNELLEQGFTVLHASTVEDSQAVFSFYTLYKPDIAVDLDSELTTRADHSMTKLT
jgi:hypothetical protein